MNMLVRSAFWMLLVLLGIPAWAQTIPEREPNDTKEQAMTLQPGVTVAGTFSRSHASSLRRGEDVDHYRITGLASPGTYTVTITPGNPACRYVADVAHTPLVIQGTTTVVFELTGQGTTRVTRRYGNLAEERVTLPNEPRELAVLLYNPSFQCVSGGPYYDEIPYRISVASGSAPAANVAQGTAGPAVAGQTVQEREPNDTKEQAMMLQPDVTVLGTFSRPHATAIRRGEDVDHYRVTGLVAPGTYTVTITPGNPACRYVADVAHTPLVIQGTTTVVFELTGQGSTRVTRRYGNRAEERVTIFSDLRELDILLYNPSFQCVEGGPYYDEIPYRLAITAGSAAVAASSATAATPAVSAGPAGSPALTREFTIAPGSALEVQLPAARTLELLARLAYDKPAGANFALDVSVNGQRLASPLLNKAQSFRYADGRSFPYYDAAVPGWLVFYSPDFAVNDTPGAGGYQVMTDAGQSYRYQWDIAALANAGPGMRVRLYNNGRGANSPVVVRLPQAAMPVTAAPSPPPSASLPPLKPPLQGARIYDITAAREVAWGQPVGPGNVFAPDVNPIYVWFHHQGLPSGATITAVWYFLSTVTPTRIGDGSVTVTPPSDWGQFNFELAAGKRWPAGDYRVELLVAGQAVGEARFRIAANAP